MMKVKQQFHFAFLTNGFTFRYSFTYCKIRHVVTAKAGTVAITAVAYGFNLRGISAHTQGREVCL
jgi:hypothetical protein